MFTKTLAHKNFRAIVGVWSALLLGLSACSLAGDIPPPPNSEVRTLASPTAASQTVQPDPAQGALLYAKNCARCHGINGNGNSELAAQLPVTPLDFTDRFAVADRSPQQWFDTITNGKIENLMPPWEQTLNAADRWHLVAYLTTLSIAPELWQAGEQDATTASLADWQTASLSSRLANLQNTQPNQAAALAEYQRTAWFAPYHPAANPALQGTGELKGNVSGLPELGNIAITVRVFDKNELLGIVQTYTDRNGQFRVTDLSLPTDGSLLATAQLPAVRYAGAIVPITANLQHYQTSIQLYPSTTDTSQLQISEWDMLLTSASNSLEVTEVVTFVNAGTQTVIAAAGQAVLRLPVPTDASNLTFSNQSPLLARNSVFENGAVQIRTALPPSGEQTYQLIYRYSLPFGASLNLNKQVPLAVKTARVLLPISDLMLQTNNSANNQLQAVGQPTIWNDQTYQAYERANLPAAGVWQLTISRPKALTYQWLLNGDSGMTTGLAVLLLLGSAAGAFWLIRRP